MLTLIYVFLATALAGTIALVPDAVLDPVRGEREAGVVVLVDKGRITQLVSTPPADATVIDLSGTTLVPGYIDAHTHLLARMPHMNNMDAMAREATSYRAIQGVVKAASLLEWGFTTVRDVGNAGNYGDMMLKRAVNEGLVPGPDMVACGRIITPFGGQSYKGPERPDHEDEEYLYADSPDEARKAVRQNIYYEADCIKVVVDPNNRYTYTPAELEALVDEAHRANRAVAAHVQTLKGAELAIAAGVDSLEHAFKLDDQQRKAAKKAGIAIVPTPFTAEALEGYGKMPMEKRQRIAAGHVARVRQMHEAGNTLVFGTDVMQEPSPGRSDGEVTLGYVDSFAEAGLSPIEVLQTMTSSAATLLRREDRGRIEPLYRADLVAVEGDPSADSRALKNVVFVMKAGEVVRERGPTTGK